MVSKTKFRKASELMQVIEDLGYRTTVPREALVRTIASKDGHFTAEELNRELPSVGRATVYRSLNLLEEAGVLCRVLLEDGSLRYQVSHRGHHHHLLCTECGQSQDLLGCEIDDLLNERSKQHNFKAESHWLEVYGKCGNCLSKADS